MRDWVGRPVDIVFDFGARDEDIAAFGRPVLWQLHPDPHRRVLVTPIYTAAFIEMLHKGGALQRVFYKPAPPPPLFIPPQLGRPRHVRSFREMRWIQRNRPRL